MNPDCQNVFGQWISQKLKDLALVGFSLGAISLVTIYMSYYVWYRLSHGAQKIFWHSKPIEAFFLGLNILLIIALSIWVAVANPDPPIIYPFAAESPSHLQSTEVN